MRRATTGSRLTTVEPGHLHGLHRILVALDGTPFAEAALPTAVALARTYGAEIVLVRAHMARADAIHTMLGLRRHERETLARASLYLARIEQELLADGIRAVSVSPVGRAADAIADVAAGGCDLILLATHATGGLRQASQVSVARELATRSDVPMVLLSPAAKGLFSESTASSTFVVALQGERSDGTALRLVAELATRLGRGVTAVCSRSGLQNTGEHEVGQAAAEARATAYLDEVRTQLARQNVAAWTVLTDGDVLAEVTRLARGGGDLIVLGSSGTLGRREAIAEAATALLYHTGSAVLLVPHETLGTALPGGRADQVPAGGRR